jgi:hypothetical protein
MCKFNPHFNFFGTLFVWNLEGGNLICIYVLVIWVVRPTNWLIAKLQRRFHAHDLMDCSGVVYPQYWL